MRARFPGKNACLAALALAALGLGGCSAVSVEFRGKKTTPIAGAAQIEYADVMPEDHESVGKLDIQCRVRRGEGGSGSGSGSSFPTALQSGVPALDLSFAGVGLLLFLLSTAAGGGSRSGPPATPCEDAAIDQEVRERTAEAGGTLVVGMSCNDYEAGTTVTSQCTAEVGRRIPEQDIPPLPPGEVRARFIPATGKPQTVPMSPNRVEIAAEAPRSAMLLGAVLGGCLSECTRETVEPKLRQAAAKAGAPLLSDVTCGPERGAFICRSKAWLPIERAAPPAPDGPSQ